MSDVFNEIASVVVNAAEHSGEIAGSVGSVLADVKNVGGAHGTDIGTRIGAAEDLLAQIVGFLTYLFPAHPGLPKQ
jgi:hypothetical protein